MKTDNENVQALLDDIAIKASLIASEFKEYDESIENEVETITCPQCGHIFPK